jgi:hypothetical protein
VTISLSILPLYAFYDVKSSSWCGFCASGTSLVPITYKKDGAPSGAPSCVSRIYAFSRSDFSRFSFCGCAGEV